MRDVFLSNTGSLIYKYYVIYFVIQTLHSIRLTCFTLSPVKTILIM